MSGLAPDATPAAGLGRLLDQLSRDGWLVGLNTDVDPALTRMDPETGVYNDDYLSTLIAEAVADARAGRLRLLDGPAQGSVALVSIRISDRSSSWPDAVVPPRVASEVARRLAGCLRAEDALGRPRPDTFTLLLRGCPEDRLVDIAGRCVDAVNDEPVVTEWGINTVGGVAVTIQWDGRDATAFVDQAASAFEGIVADV